MTLPVKETAAGLILSVWVQPRASRNEPVGLHREALKIRLTAPPVDNAANQLCLKNLAKWLGVPRATLSIVAGAASRKKKILIRYQTRPATDEEKAAIRKAVAMLF